MKILHLTKRYPNSAGGDGTVVANLKHYQETAGHDVRIVTSNCPDIVTDKSITKFGLRIASSEIDSISPKRIITLLGMAIYAFWSLKKDRPDVIHSHTMDFGYAYSFAARLYGIPMINTCHGICFNNPYFSPAKRWLEKFLLRHARYRKIITVDASSVKDFEATGLGPVQYRPNGVVPGRFKQHRPNNRGPLRLLFVGRLEAQKGLPVLLESLKALDTPHRDFELLVAGDGPDRALSEAAATHERLAGKVEFLGRKSQDELVELYASADILVIPSMHEGFPLVLLEAWAAGLPVLITSVGGVPMICHHREDSWIVPPGDAEALTAGITTLMSDPLLRMSLGTQGRKLVDSKYNYDAVAGDLETLYRELT